MFICIWFGPVFIGFSSHWITSMIQFYSNVISMVAPTWCMDPMEGTHLGECWQTDLWIYTFNLVFRLSIVKQSAIPFTTILQLLAAPVVLANPRQISSLLKSDCWNSRSWPFMTESAYDSIRSYHLACKATGMSFSCRYGLFGTWWGWIYYAPNSFELEQPFNAHLWVWPTTVPSGE